MAQLARKQDQFVATKRTFIVRKGEMAGDSPYEGESPSVTDTLDGLEIHRPFFHYWWIYPLVFFLTAGSVRSALWLLG